MSDPIPLVLVKNEPVAPLVAYLEELLERAKSEELQGAAVATRNSDGAFDTWWGSGWSGCDFVLVTAIARLGWRYQNEAFSETAEYHDGPA